MTTFLNRRAGIDGGGVFKEFLTSLCKEVFDSDRGLWLSTKNNELYPNPHSYATECTSFLLDICPGLGTFSLFEQLIVLSDIVLSVASSGRHFTRVSSSMSPLLGSS